jgi:CRAL/TRIO domain
MLDAQTLSAGIVLEFIKGAAKTAGRHYVERAYKIYVVNAPPWFSFAWAVVSPFIDARTRKKVTLHLHIYIYTAYICTILVNAALYIYYAA